jgi:hypothetical protein
MQTQDKTHGMPQPPMVVQPLGSVTVDPMKGYNNVEVKYRHNPFQNFSKTLKIFQLEVPSHNGGSHLQGVYRQRSYDNLQNGKSQFHRSSIKSLHLPPTYAIQSNQHQQLNKKFSLSIQKFAAPLSMHRGYSPSPQHPSQAIPSNFKLVSPQSQYHSGASYDSNSLPRYPYHKNRALQSNSQHHGMCIEYYKYSHIRHPTTPPPPPPIHLNRETDEQNLLPTPSSSSSGDTCNGEWDPMIASGSSGKRSGIDHMTQYRTCKKQMTQMLQPNPQHQMYIDNYLHHLSHQSPYRKYLNAVQNHQLQMSPQNVHVYHNPAKRHSNAYEYHFTNFDLNSIHEDARNES